MVIQVNKGLCAGCGLCMDACTVGAIQLVDQRAVIDNALCTQCEACIDACLNGAITAFSVPAHSALITALPVTGSRLIPTRQPVALQEIAAPARNLASIAGTALAFLGREVAPRLADMLIAALERKLARPTTTAMAPLPTSSRSLTAGGKGERRQARYRRGRVGYGNHEERR